MTSASASDPPASPHGAPQDSPDPRPDPTGRSASSPPGASLPVQDSPNEPEPAMRAPQGLVLVATPIGHLGDLSDRARSVLGSADLVLCEDTRVTGRLLARFSIDARLQVLNDHTEAASVEQLLPRLALGARIALVSDAGQPVLSDPGFRLVRAAIEAGIPVTAVPGPNAAVTALALSGLPPAPFLFLGFLPPRAHARGEAIARIAAAEAAGLAASLVLYEAPHRVAETLADLASILGADRPAALARELTKRFEEVRRGPLASLASQALADPPRGEITLVVGPPSEREAAPLDLDAALREALARHSVRDAAALVAAATGRPKREVYARALALGAED